MSERHLEAFIFDGGASALFVMHFWLDNDWTAALGWGVRTVWGYGLVWIGGLVDGGKGRAQECRAGGGGGHMSRRDIGASGGRGGRKIKTQYDIEF